MREQFKYKGKRAALSIAAAVMAFLSLIPLLVLLQLAFHQPSQLTGNGVLSFQGITLRNFPVAFESSNLLQGMRNSAVIAVLSLILTVLFASAASYEIARFPSALNGLAYLLFLFSMAIPSIISTVPALYPDEKVGSDQYALGDDPVEYGICDAVCRFFIHQFYQKYGKRHGGSGQNRRMLRCGMFFPGTLSYYEARDFYRDFAECGHFLERIRESGVFSAETERLYHAAVDLPLHSKIRCGLGTDGGCVAGGSGSGGHGISDLSEILYQRARSGSGKGIK